MYVCVVFTPSAVSSSSGKTTLWSIVVVASVYKCTYVMNVAIGSDTTFGRRPSRQMPSTAYYYIVHRCTPSQPCPENSNKSCHASRYAFRVVGIIRVLRTCAPGKHTWPSKRLLFVCSRALSQTHTDTYILLYAVEISSFN